MANELYRNRMLNDIDYAVREAKSAALLAHNGLVGRVRELMVSRLLAPMLPAGFEVGTGKITNAAGALSHETDLVIYNRSILPPVFYSDRDGVFPLESSYYAIEVKSKLTAADIKTSVKKGASITALSQRSPDSNTLHSSPTVLVLFAFDSDLAQESEIERYAKYDLGCYTDPVFKAICVVGRGYWYHDIKRAGWIFHAATADRDEIVDLVSGVVNTLVKTPPASRLTYLGNYLMTSRSISFVGAPEHELSAQEAKKD